MPQKRTDEAKGKKMKFLVAIILFGLAFGGLVLAVGSTTDPKAASYAECSNPRASAFVWSPIGAAIAFLGMVAIGFVLLMWATSPG